MLRSDTFWSYEKDAPLLTLNRGFLQRQGDPLLFERVSTWLASAGVDVSESVVLVEVEKPDRIFVADAERTFRHDANRARFVKLLAHLASSFGDYAQGLSYVSSFLLLTMNESDVISLLSRLNANERYLPGYWKHEAIKFATDAYVFQELLTKHLPLVSEHLQKSGVDPTTYCQKWFVGLCVHVLPFEYLFTYFEGFLEGGYKFLMQFGLSLLTQLQDKLLAIHNNPSASFGLLRLDPKFIHHDEHFYPFLQKVFAGVQDFDLSEVNFKELREKTYDKYLKARVESAHKLHNREEDSDDEIEDCQICLDDFPEVFCKDCKLKICENCHNNPSAESSHLRSHRIKQLEDEEESEKEDEAEDENEEDDDAPVGKVLVDLEKLRT